MYMYMHAWRQTCSHACIDRCHAATCRTKDGRSNHQLPYCQFTTSSYFFLVTTLQTISLPKPPTCASSARFHQILRRRQSNFYRPVLPRAWTDFVHKGILTRPTGEGAALICQRYSCSDSSVQRKNGKLPSHTNVTG